MPVLRRFDAKKLQAVPRLPRNDAASRGDRASHKQAGQRPKIPGRSPAARTALHLTGGSDSLFCGWLCGDESTVCDQLVGHDLFRAGSFLVGSWPDRPRLLLAQLKLTQPLRTPPHYPASLAPAIPDSTGNASLIRLRSRHDIGLEAPLKREREIEEGVRFELTKPAPGLSEIS